GIGAAAVDRLVDQIDAVVLIDLGLRQCRMDHVFGIDVLQHRDGRPAAGLLESIVGLVFAVGRHQQSYAFAVIGNREVDLLGTLRVDRHELAGNVDFAGGGVRG